MKKCPFCSSEFATNADFVKHLEIFGWNKEKHLQKLEELRQKTEKERLD